MKRTRADIEAENRRRKRAFDWIKGWKHGATFSEIPYDCLQNADFNDGWREGHEAMRLARTQAEEKFGYKMVTIKAI